MESIGHSLAEGVARVVAVENGMAVLEADRAGACGGCKAKSGCGTATLAGGTSARFVIPDDFHARIGETVVVAIEAEALTRASAIAYIIPLAGMIGAAVAATMLGAGDAGTAAATVLGLIGGIAVARRRAGRLEQGGRLRPVFLRRAPVEVFGCNDSGKELA